MFNRFDTIHERDKQTAVARHKATGLESPNQVRFDEGANGAGTLRPTVVMGRKFVGNSKIFTTNVSCEICIFSTLSAILCEMCRSALCG